MSGALIVIEGPDCVGKSSAVKAVSGKLAEAGVAHVVCREPGGTPFSEAMRGLVLNAELDRSVQVEVFALLAAKADLLERVIYPALREGQVVLCDRFTRSLLAYQGALRGVAYQDLIRLLAHGQVLVMPHLEILLEADRDTRLLRQAARQGVPQDHLEAAAMRHVERLEEGYRQASDYLFAQSTTTIDTTHLTEDEVAVTLFDQVQRYLKFHAITQPTIAPLTYDDWQEMILERREKASVALHQVA